MKHILLIEDDAPLCWLLGKILKTRYDVTIINNGMEAWSWLSEGNMPDLIIYGINDCSPQACDLLENIRLSGLYCDIPVVVLSGVDAPALEIHCRAIGAFSYISKPFEPQLFLSEIQRGLLHRSEVVFID